MIESRGDTALTTVPDWRSEDVRRKALIVTNNLPGHDAGFEKSGHAHYLQSFVTHLRERHHDVVFVVFRPSVDFLWLRKSALAYDVESPAFAVAGPYLIHRKLRAIVAIVLWHVFSWLPRPLQSLASALRLMLRRARGFSHVMGTFIDDTEIDFVKTIVARERPDLILYDSLFNVCGRLGDAQQWVITHEVKHERARSFEERGVAVIPAGLGEAEERRILGEIGNVIAIQWDDEAEFHRLLPSARTVVVPVSIGVPGRLERKPSATPRCLFVGSGSYHNIHGIEWFLTSCWPHIRQAVPMAVLDIYGTVCFRLKALPDGVVAHGVAADLADAYRDATVAIVPLQIGSGLKVKLVEALAFGLPVVTTPVGAQGLTAFAPQPFMLAASAQAFSDACIALLTQPETARELAAAARSCAERFAPHAAFAEFAAESEAQFCAARTTLPASRARRSGRRICIGIPTFRRNELLPGLFFGLAAQRLTDAEFEVVIFDNDTAGGAAPVVAEWKARVPYALGYEHVPQPGLAMVRNRILAYAIEAQFDYVAMIDDDEVPDATWLAELLRLVDAKGIDVAVGPVVPVAPPGSPPWIRELRALETPMHADGALLRDGWSCNALVSLAAVRARDVWFDAALNYAGGEDQLFFRLMRARGATIAFASAAVVRESIPPDRLTVRFNLRRAYRRGNSLSYCERRLDGSWRCVAVRAAKAAVYLGIGLVNMASALYRGEAILVRYACQVAGALGMLAGLGGRLYQAYERTEP